MKKHTPEIVERAAAFAIEAHGDQMYGKDPYYYHLRAVVSTLQAFGIWDKKLLAAAYLHDVIEDTPVTKEQVEAEFGSEIAAIVDACTDGPGKTRKERKKRPYSLIPTVPGAATVKLADRLSNVLSNLVEGNAKLMLVYKKEQPHLATVLEHCFRQSPDSASTAMLETLDLQLRHIRPKDH